MASPRRREGFLLMAELNLARSSLTRLAREFNLSPAYEHGISCLCWSSLSRYDTVQGIASWGVFPGKSNGADMKAIESRSPVDQCLLFRLQDEDNWRNGRTVNVSRSGLLFSSAQSLEVGTVVEIDLDLQQLIGCENVRFGVVVRRVLMAWPDLNALVAIRFLEDSARADRASGEQIAG